MHRINGLETIDDTLKPASLNLFPSSMESFIPCNVKHTFSNEVPWIRWSFFCVTDNQPHAATIIFSENFKYPGQIHRDVLPSVSITVME